MSEREILFRGKRKDNGDWIYGVPITDEATNDTYIITSTAGASLKSEINNMCATGFRIIRNTIGQYTGLTDKNGLTKIFEYDIIDANGRKVGNYYENSNLLKDGTCFLVAKMGTKEWSRSEQEAIKRGCKYAE